MIVKLKKWQRFLFNFSARNTVNIIFSVQSIFLIGVYAVLGSISHNATQCNSEYYNLTNQI